MLVGTAVKTDSFIKGIAGGLTKKLPILEFSRMLGNWFNDSSDSVIFGYSLNSSVSYNVNFPFYGVYSGTNELPIGTLVEISGVYDNGYVYKITPVTGGDATIVNLIDNERLGIVLYGNKAINTSEDTFMLLEEGDKMYSFMVFKKGIIYGLSLPLKANGSGLIDINNGINLSNPLAILTKSVGSYLKLELNNLGASSSLFNIVGYNAFYNALFIEIP